MTHAGFLALADGEIFHGVSAGAPVDNVGEVVFNTGMTGYQEIISDPSYAGQIVTLTTAEVGNYGCNADDMESRQLFLHGFIVQNLNPPSNFRSQIALDEMLKQNRVPALTGVDTRKLTLKLRSSGTMKAFLHCAPENKISPDDAVAKARAWEGLDGQDYAAKVSAREKFQWSEGGELRVVAYDFGIKYNILRELERAGMKVTVVPAWTTAEEVLALKPDGVFLSNGPADPSAVTGAIAAAKNLIGKTPLMGICLGHQIIGIASGCACGRLKFGHHGCNHPVKDLQTGAVQITSQNHNYAVRDLPTHLELTHLNLNDQTVEGIRHRREPVFAVQYHPEAAPGPHDAHYLFAQFREMMVKA
jgi:carbamoyl-phosphate synthase small subunit